MKHIYILVLCCCFLTLPSFADVNYSLNISQPAHHLGDVKVGFPLTNQTYLDVKFPSWRTGRYEILDMASGVRHFDAKDEKGNPLKWHKIDSNTWRVLLPKPSEVILQYQVYANELGLRSRHIDDSHAFIDASGFFMFAQQYRQSPITVQLHVPEKWRSVSGLEMVNNRHQFKAPNYDVFVDSPIETGINQLYQWQVDGRDYELVVWGHGNYDIDKTIKDLKKLVKTGRDIWHQYPYQRYVFMVHATSGARGATEHLNSTIIQRKRDTFAKRSDYLAFMTTAAHEFVHTWNVKAYRPQGLTPYKYTQHNYTDLLWVAEGSTSYFDDQLLVRADIMTLTEYFKSLNKSINQHLATPGKTVQSVAHTSYDKWINQGGDHAKNFSTNIYAEGSLVSWLLDIDLLKRTDGKVSYRDVHRQLYQQYPLPSGYQSDDVKAVLKQLTGHDYDTWWQHNVEMPAHIDFDSLLNTVGLQFKKPKNTKQQVSLNVNSQYHNGLVTLTHVKREGAAWHANLTTQDVLVAINDKAITQPLNDYLQQFKPGETVKVRFFRRDTLLHKEVIIGTKVPQSLGIELVAAPTQMQKQLFEAWLGKPYPDKL